MITKEVTREQLSMLCYDNVFKSMFASNINLLARMIADITGIDYSILEDNIILESNEIPISKNNEKVKKCDFVVRIDDNYLINLELNRQSNIGLVIRNLSYAFGLYATNFSKGEEYNDNLKIIQININCYRDKYNKKALSKYYIKEDDDGEIYSNSLKIYSLNVVNCHELYYNLSEKEIPKYARWGELLYNSDDEKIPIIVKGIMSDRERNIFMEEYDKVRSDKYIISDADAIRMEEKIRKSMYNEGKAEGKEEGENIGRKKGIEENTIKIIKLMLKNKIDINTISKITGKSSEEIEKIKEI